MEEKEEKTGGGGGTDGLIERCLCIMISFDIRSTTFSSVFERRTVTRNRRDIDTLLYLNHKLTL